MCLRGVAELPEGPATGPRAAGKGMKEKRRSNEKRKEKSRDAARCRRSRETDIFTELAGALPVPECEAAHLDKASVMRLAIAYLKTRTLMDAVPKPVAKPEISPEMDELSIKALDGFVLVLDNNGDMAYTSPNVKDYLGIAQMDLMGQSVFDYSHPCDHDEIRESLSLKASEVSEDHPCNLFLRLKCTLTSKGRKVNLKSASYKVIHCSGRLVAHASNPFINNEDFSDSENQKEIEVREPGVSLVVIASPVPHPSNIEIPLGRYTFLSKHSLNMKFTYADDKLAEFLGWESSDLIGQPVFDFHHALDNQSLDRSFKSLFSKGQCETMAYRFLNKRGGYAWVVTQATLIHCSRLQKPQSVVCVNYLLSGVEREDEVYSVRQLEARDARLKKEYEEARWCLDPAVPLAEFAQPDRKPLVEKPVSVTASLFRFQERPKPQAIIKGTPRINIDGKENESDKVKDPVPTQGELQENKPQQQLLTPDFGVEPLAPELYQSSIGSVPAPLAPREAPQTATASIFAPRTKDMNKGFLTFSEDQPGLTMLKDEPEDLTHLAPTAGDVCVPLEEPPFLSDMLDEFINSNYCPLLSPELPSEPTDQLADQSAADSRVSVVLIESPKGLTINTSGPTEDLRSTDQQQTILSDSLNADDCCNSSDTGGDPFIYRDSPSRCSLGTDLHSPAITKSPDGSGIGDSLNSPNGSGLSEDEMLMLSISDVMADDELALRAPYIPMSDQDEALQLLISDDMVMWGPSQTSDKKSKWLTDASEDNANSSLAQLLTNESISKKTKDNGGATLVNPAQVLGQISVKSAPKELTAVPEMRSNKRVHTPYNSISNNGRGSNSSSDSKRVKHCNSSEVDPGGVGPPTNTFQSSLESLLSGSMQSSQLLQQLVSQQQQQGINCKPRSNWHESSGPPYNNNIRSDDDGGGGGLMRGRSLLAEDDGGGKQMFQRQQRQQQQQQSNSVLMNLLVSGCDMPGINDLMQNPMPPGLGSNRVIGQQHQGKLPPPPLPMQMRLMGERLQQTIPQWMTNNETNSPLLTEPNIDPKQEQQQLQSTYDSMVYDDDDELNRFMNSPNLMQGSDEIMRALEPRLA